MRTPIYRDIHIWSLDLAYIERVSEELDIDTWDAELYSLENGWPIANDIIYHIQYQAVWNLEISEKSRGKLRDSMYTNCIDSGFDIDVEDFPKNEREIIQNFISLF